MDRLNRWWATPFAGWQKMQEDSGFTDITIGPAADTFGGATGEANGRAFEVHGCGFLARKPSGRVQSLTSAALKAVLFPGPDGAARNRGTIDRFLARTSTSLPSLSPSC